MGSERTEILMLHRVMPDEPVAFGLPTAYRLRGTALTPKEFETLLNTVGAVLPLHALEEALAANRAPPPGTVLTFDDGYREHLEVIAPALAARGQTATFYVATGLRGDGHKVAVVDAWYWLLDHAQRPTGRVSLGAGEWYSGRLDTEAGKMQWVAGTPKAWLLSSPPTIQQALLDSLADSLGVELPANLARSLYVSRQAWQGLVRAGMRVGAHSVSHARLTQLADDELDREITNSSTEIAALGDAVSFAYPDGNFDARVLDRAKALTSSAVTCLPGVVTAQSILHALPRTFVRGGTMRCRSS